MALCGKKEVGMKRLYCFSMLTALTIMFALPLGAHAENACRVAWENRSTGRHGHLDWTTKSKAVNAFIRLNAGANPFLVYRLEERIPGLPFLHHRVKTLTHEEIFKRKHHRRGPRSDLSFSFVSSYNNVYP